LKGSHIVLGLVVAGIATAIGTEIVERLALRWFGPKA
jgi:hypothetical protein